MIPLPFRRPARARTFLPGRWGLLPALVLFLGILPATPLEARQGAGAQGGGPPLPMVAASGRVTTSVAFDGRLVGPGLWLNRSTAHSGPALLLIDYGQPHARGREIFGGLVPFDAIWRLGANMATHLRADLHVRLGDLAVPQGLYTLYLLPGPDGAELVVNRSTGQWGTEYTAAEDLGRVAMEARTLPEPIESLSITLEPEFPQPEGTLPRGVLRVAWGTMEYRVPWSVDPP